MADRYGRDVLAVDPNAARRRRVAEVAAEPGLVVECVESGWCGAVVGTDKGADGWAVLLEDRHGVRRPFALRPAAFLLDGEVVTLVRPAAATTDTPARTASGSIAVTGHRAVVARGSRIWVEGLHDAELVEKVWGHDLRVEGVVVEPLHGADDLVALVREFAPGPGRRRCRMALAARARAQLRRPRAEPARQGRGAHRRRDRPRLSPLGNRGAAARRSGRDRQA